MTQKKIHWGESYPAPGDPVYNTIVAIVIRNEKNKFEAMGTGFITGITAKGAFAVSAAHVFDDIYKRQCPSEPRPRTLFTREVPQRIDLDPDRVFALFFQANRAHILRLKNLYYDHGSDMAGFEVEKLKPDNRKIFTHNIRFDADMAKVGDDVEGIGFKNMAFAAEMNGAALHAAFQGTLTRRHGTVTEVLERTIKLKGPGAHVSFPIFGGMSGGPVLRRNTGKPSAAFAILSSDYEDPEELKNDVYIPGTTTISKLPIEWIIDSDGQRALSVRMLSDDEGTGN